MTAQKKTTKLEELLGTPEPEAQAAVVQRLMQGHKTILVHIDTLRGDVQVVPVGRSLTMPEIRDTLAGVCEILLRQERKAAAEAASLAASKDGGQ